MGLLLKDRAPEADIALNKALAMDAKNPFTLNNLGWAKEKEGELELANRYYSQAHDLNSNEPVIVTVNKGWRGKSISEIAGENAKNVRKMMGQQESNDAKVARLNLRGVSAVNRNDRRLARQYFEQAYKLDPNNAFTLNNMGYIAELDGDRETANFFYDKATEAQRSDSRVAVATRRDLEGMRMSNVATANGQAVDQAVQTSLEERRREGGPVVLKRRDNTPIVDPDRPPPKPQPSEPQGQTQQERIPVYSQPDTNAPIQEVMPPLENQPNGTQPANPSAPGGALPQGSEPQQQQPTPTQPPQPAPGQNAPDANSPVQGVIAPLPDNQQPPNAGQQPPPQNPK